MKRLPPIVKPIIVMLSGYVLSRLLYPITHGDDKRLPELYGIAAGCLLVNVAMYLLFGRMDSVIDAFIAEALVGLGVAGNRGILQLGAHS